MLFFEARTWADIDDLNRQARAWCESEARNRKCPEDDTLLVQQAFEQERPLLLPLPKDDFPVDERHALTSGKTPYLRFDFNDYSIPHTLVRRPLTLVATTERVEILNGLHSVASHPRSYDRHAQIEDPKHIQDLHELKKQLHYSRGLDRLHHSVPATRELFVAAAERNTNLGSLTSGLLRLLDRYGSRELMAATHEALAQRTPHVAAVRLILERRLLDSGKPPPIAIDLPHDSRVRDLVVHTHNLNDYTIDAQENDRDDSERK